MSQLGKSISEIAILVFGLVAVLSSQIWFMGSIIASNVTSKIMCLILGLGWLIASYFIYKKVD